MKHPCRQFFCSKPLIRGAVAIFFVTLAFIVWRRSTDQGGVQNRSDDQSKLTESVILPLTQSSPILTEFTDVVHMEEIVGPSRGEFLKGEPSVMAAAGVLGDLWRLHCAGLEGRRGYLWEREMEAFRLVNRSAFEAIEAGGKFSLTLLHPGDRGFPAAFRPKSKDLPDALSGLSIERRAYRQGRDKLEAEMRAAASVPGLGTQADKAARWRDGNRKKIVENILEAEQFGERPASLEVSN